MKKMHLLCNAHLDPVWLWPREEGIAEAISTFRVAADFCEKYDSYIFNHNESLLYEWVEEYEPALFERIKKLVKAGKWHIMGGWYLQPDCLMPSAEGFLRQIEVGNKYFLEKFGVKPTTAINFDSFGHTRGLVQIMKKSGYDSYIFMRPNGMIPENDFKWRGYDGSEIYAHCINGGYATNKGKALSTLENAVSIAREGNNLMLWGIGNHGGGPSEEDLNAINDYIEKHPEIEIEHSFAEKYFAEKDMSAVHTEERSLMHIFVGCYTSMTRVKQAYRALENELITAEKMLAAADIDADITTAEKALLFSQFHDSLPGTMIKKGEEQVIKLLSSGSETLSAMTTKAFYKLCEGQKKAKRGEVPVMVFNPHPFEVTEIIEMEFLLEHQNWNDNEVTLVKVRDENGNYLPAQNEKESSSINVDWRKRVAFKASLKPMSLTRFDCEFIVENYPVRPITPCEQTDTHFVLSNNKMTVMINKSTGLIDKYEVGGEDYLKAGSARINVFNDYEDPWGMKMPGFMTEEGFRNKIGEFTLLADKEANAFRGYPEEKLSNVRVIENGDVRLKIEAIFKNRNSFAVITYTLPKNDSFIDISVKTLANDPNTMYKLSFDTTLEGAELWGQTAYGREVMRNDGLEVCYQKWCALNKQEKTFAVLNKGTYGGSAEKGMLNISLMRTPVYSAHPIENRQLIDHDRCHDHIDMGEHEFNYRLTTNGDTLDNAAESYNQSVYAISFFPSGEGEKKDTEVCLDNDRIVLSSLRKKGDAKLLRLFNSSDKAQTAVLKISGKEFKLSFDGFEAAAYKLENGKLCACSLSGV